MGNDDRQQDQLGLWDDDVATEHERQTTRRPRRSTQGASDCRSTAAPAGPGEAERLWTVAEVAVFLGVPKKTIYAWRTTGKGPKGFRVGKHLRWHPHAVFAWALQMEDEQ